MTTSAEILSDPTVRPRLRGVIHRYAAGAFAAAFVSLAVLSGDAGTMVWIAAYGVCVTAMLAVSATYHSGRLSPATHRFFRRLDHSMILVAIAGSYTGVVGLGMEAGDRTFLLVAVWSLSAVGVAIRMLWLGAPYPVIAAVYLAVGWVALLDIGTLVDALSGAELGLVVLGGVLYSLGAAVYALHAPDPWPRTFGYHEIFHTIVVLAAATHFAAVALIVA